MLAFNEYGLLPPGKPIITSLDLFEKTFVTDFESKTRVPLFKHYQHYVATLQTIIGNEFYQWIDGSYVTKKENPNDLDVVTFIDFTIAEKYKKQLKNFQYPNSVEKFNIDGYLVRVFDDDHPKRIAFQSDKLYWWHLFEKVKGLKSRKKFKKGFLEIHYKEENL